MSILRFNQLFISAIVVLLCCWGVAQEAVQATETPDTSVEATEVIEEAQEGVEVEEETTQYGLAEFGFGVGWPGYHLYNVRASFQNEALGVALEASATEIGVYAVLSGRYYLPTPVVPTYLSAGAGVFGPEYLWTVAAGAHIPLGIDGWRLGLEGGVTQVTLSQLDTAQVLPYVTLSLGYSFPVDMTNYERNRERSEVRFASGGDSSTCTTSEPDASTLGGTFYREVSDFAATLRATYAGSYRDASYSVDIDDISVNGDTGEVSASFSGSVVEIISGEVITGGGSISATFSWTGCGWYLEDYDYDA